MSVLQRAFGADATILRESNFRLLLLSTVFPILGTAVVSPVLDSMIVPLGTTPANVGLIVSALTAPAILVIPISGVLADRYGRKPVLVVALLLFGAGGSVIALTTDFRVVLGLRFVQGAGFGGIVPIITASIGDMYDGSREVTGQGLRMMVNGLSATVFPLLAGSLVAFAWQYPFLLYAAAFPVAAVVALRFEEPTADGSESGSTEAATDSASYRRALFGLVGRPRVAALIIGRTLPIPVWVGFMTYNSLVVVRLMDGTPFQAGVLVAVGSFVFAVSASQVGRLLVRFGGKFVPLLGANVALALGFVGFLLAPRVGLAVLPIALLGVGFGVSLSLYRSYITELSPKSLRGGVVSLGAAGARVTATVTPIAMGLVIGVGTPIVGEAISLQIAGVATAFVGGIGGILCVLVAASLGPVTEDHPDPARH